MGFKNFFMNKTLLFFSILFFISPHANAESFFDKAIKKGFSIFYGVKGDTILTCNNNQIVQFNSGSRPYKYTLANIIGKEYSREWLPASKDLKRDLLYLHEIYSDWAALSVPIDDEEFYQSYNNLFEIDSEDIREPGNRQSPKVLMPGAYAPIRSLKAGSIALQNANYMCEYNNVHTTFFVLNGVQYMEKHHLIPIKHYLDYKIDIDHPYNIYCLCPNCHKRVQYSDKKDKSRIIGHLYNLRKDKFLNIYKSSLGKIKRYYS